MNTKMKIAMLNGQQSTVKNISYIVECASDLKGPEDINDILYL